MGQLTFQAQSAVSPAPARMDFYVSRDQAVDNGGAGEPDRHISRRSRRRPPSGLHGQPGLGCELAQQARHLLLAAGVPRLHRGRSQLLRPHPIADPRRARTPDASSPADGTTIEYGGQRTFSIADVPSYTHDGTHLNIEFSRSDDLAPDGTFANPLLIVPRPASAGGDLYKTAFAKPFTYDPGTYYWIAERFDCAAESDCYVTNDEVRSFTVARPILGNAPNTRLTRHPGHRTQRRRVVFRFSSSLPGASFQCFYTGGWTPCHSPQKFRHLKPGRYRFKVRAIANGRRDPTPARFLFKVVRHRRH